MNKKENTNSKEFGMSIVPEDEFEQLVGIAIDLSWNYSDFNELIRTLRGYLEEGLVPGCVLKSGKLFEPEEWVEFVERNESVVESIVQNMSSDLYAAYRLRTSGSN
jgi:hypothetical protein